MQFKTKKTLLALALVGVFGGAQATLLAPNVPSLSVDVVANSFGGLLLDSAVTNISNASYNGIARTAVYQNGIDGGLDFYYQFSNDASSLNGIERFSGFNFASLAASAVNVFQTGTAFGIFTTGTEVSDYADRSTANVIAFSFVPNGLSKIAPGTTSYTQIVRTNAKFYQPGNFAVIDGIADNAVGFAAAVPEPETYALLLAGLGMVGTIIRRRKAKQG
jgi:hypothetical protein